MVGVSSNFNSVTPSYYKKNSSSQNAQNVNFGSVKYSELAAKAETNPALKEALDGLVKLLKDARIALNKKTGELLSGETPTKIDRTEYENWHKRICGKAPEKKPTSLKVIEFSAPVHGVTGTHGSILLSNGRDIKLKSAHTPVDAYVDKGDLLSLRKEALQETTEQQVPCYLQLPKKTIILDVVNTNTSRESTFLSEYLHSEHGINEAVDGVKGIEFSAEDSTVGHLFNALKEACSLRRGNKAVEKARKLYG